MKTEDLDRICKRILSELYLQADEYADAYQAAAAAILSSEKNCIAKQKNLSFGYLYKVGRQAAIRLLKKERKWRGRDMEQEKLDTDAFAAIDTADLLSILSVDDRRLIELRFYQQQNLEEIGDALGLSASGVQRRLQRILGELRGEIEGER